LKFDENGEKITGTHTSKIQLEVIHFGLESKYSEISFKNISIAEDMVYDERIPEFHNLLNQLVKLLK